MMKKKMLCIGITALVMSTCITGCGSADKSATMMTENAVADSGYYSGSGDLYVNQESSAAYDTEDVAEVAEEDVSGDVNSEISEVAEGDASDNEASDSRKLIRNVSMDVETEEFDTLIPNLEAKTKALGGYIEDSYTYNGRSYNVYDTRNATLTIRIPSTALDDFLSAVSEQSNVTSKNETVTDVTLQYVDLESHKKALQAEQKRLLELMEQAESVEDIITIESRLSDVRYELESQESQLRAYDNQIQYSTVYLNINEVEKYTPVAERGFFEKIRDGFSDSLSGVGKGLVNFIIWFISSLPYLVVWGIIIAVIVKIVMTIIRNKKERKERGIDRKTQRAERKALKKQRKEEKKKARGEQAVKKEEP